MAAVSNLKHWIFRSSASDFAGSGAPVARSVMPSTARQLPVMAHNGAQDDGKKPPFRQRHLPSIACF